MTGSPTSGRPKNVEEFKAAVRALKASGASDHIKPGDIAPHPKVNEVFNHVENGKVVRRIKVVAVSATGESVTARSMTGDTLNYDVSRWNLERA